MPRCNDPTTTTWWLGQEVDKKQHSALDLAVLSGSVPAVRALKIYARLLEETYMFMLERKERFIKTFEKRCGDVSTGEIVTCHRKNWKPKSNISYQPPQQHQPPHWARQFPRLRQEAYSFALGSPMESCRSPRGGFHLDRAWVGLVICHDNPWPKKPPGNKYQKVWECECWFPGGYFITCNMLEAKQTSSKSAKVDQIKLWIISCLKFKNWLPFKQKVERVVLRVCVCVCVFYHFKSEAFMAEIRQSCLFLELWSSIRKWSKVETESKLNGFLHCSLVVILGIDVWSSMVVHFAPTCNWGFPGRPSCTLSFFSLRFFVFLRMPGLVNVGLLRGRLGQRRHQTTTSRGALRPRRGGGQTPRSDEKKHVFNGDFWCFFYKGNPKGEQWNNDLKCCQQQKMWKTMLPEKRKWVVLVVLLKVASFFWQSFQGWPGFGVCMRLWQSEKKRRWFCSGCSKAFPKNLHQDVLDMKLQSSRNRALCYDRYHKSIFPWNLISLRNIRRIRSTKVMFHFRFLTWLRVAKTL